MSADKYELDELTDDMKFVHGLVDPYDVDRHGDAAEGAIDPAKLSALYGTVRTQIDEERGLVAWLRSRPTYARALLLGGAIVSLIGFGLLGSPGVYAASYSAVFLGGLGIMLGLTLSSSLRPLYRTETPTSRALLLCSGGVVAPLIGALVLFVAQDLTHAAALSDVAAMPKAAACFGTGMVVSLAVLIAWHALRRPGPTSDLKSVLAAASAGLTANLFLHTRCAATGAGHLMLGHVSIAAVLVAAFAMWWMLRRSSR